MREKLAFIWLLIIPICLAIYFAFSIASDNLKSAYENNLVPMLELGLALDEMHTIREEILLGDAVDGIDKASIHYNKIKQLDASIDKHLQYELVSEMREYEKKALGAFILSWADYKQTRDKTIAFVKSQDKNKQVWDLLKSDRRMKFEKAKNSIIDLIKLQKEEATKEFRVVQKLYSSVKVINYILLVLLSLILVWAVIVTGYMISKINFYEK